MVYLRTLKRRVGYLRTLKRRVGWLFSYPFSIYINSSHIIVYYMKLSVHLVWFLIVLFNFTIGINSSHLFYLFKGKFLLNDLFFSLSL